MNHDNNTVKTMVGTIIFVKQNIGSKSEETYPHLYQDRNHIIPIRIKGDNPFENGALVPFDGKTVEITGAFGRGRFFLIDEIRPVISGKTDSVADMNEQREI